jgi:hypothetical protein
MGLWNDQGFRDCREAGWQFGCARIAHTLHSPLFYPRFADDNFALLYVEWTERKARDVRWLSAPHQAMR